LATRSGHDKEQQEAKMEWWEISVSADGEAAEAISEFFNRLTPGCVVLEVFPDLSPSAVRVKTYFPADTTSQALRLRLEEGLWFLSRLYPIPPPTWTRLGPTDWLEAWKSSFGIQHVGHRLVIRPSWLEYQTQEGEVVITLDPGQAFGTGLHPTTRLTLRGLETRLQPGDRVLDLGTGSGILAIAAARLGAAEVWALDIDPAAVAVARENVAINGVADVVRVEQGTVGETPSGWPVSPNFDLVLVNILAETIVDLLDRGLVEWLRPAGTIVTSGILAERRSLVTAALENHGFIVDQEWLEGDWIALAGTRRALPSTENKG